MYKHQSLIELMMNASTYVTQKQARPRTVSDVFASAASEFGELGEELAIQSGYSYKEPGADGVVGEAIDTILCLLDLIHVQTAGTVTEEQLVEIASKKIEKWISKVDEAELKKERKSERIQSFAEVYEATVEIITTQRSGWDCDDDVDYEEFTADTVEEAVTQAKLRVAEINQSPPSQGDFGIILRSSKAKLVSVRRVKEVELLDVGM